jgi:uncharacterized protein YcfL
MKKITLLILSSLLLIAFSCREESDYPNKSDTNNNSAQITKENISTKILNKSDYENRTFHQILWVL